MNAAALLLCTLAAPPADIPEAALPCVRPSDLFRFPPEEVLGAHVRFAEKHLDWLDRRAAALGPDWAAREYDYRKELVRRLSLWRDARLAAVNAGDPPVCACCLRELRRGLGVAAYNAGELPALPDPAWLTGGN